MSRSWRPFFVVAISAACIACGGAPYESEVVSSTRESPLGGDALLQRKHDLERALQDLSHFHATMSALVDRRDERSIARLDDFMQRFLSRHIDPMLRPQWQSRNPELAAVDASLRFAKADLLIQLRYPRLVQEAIEDIEDRYDGRDGMLIAYPVGRQGTLGGGLEILKDRKWKG